MNWGNKILFVFIGFALLIGTLVYKSFHVQTELVTPEYYKDEIAYQQVINASQNTSDLSGTVKIEQTGKLLKLVLPEEINQSEIKGDVLLYCAYDSKRDLKFPLKLTDDGHLVYPTVELKKGHYTVKISFKDKNKSYFIEKNITVS